MPYFAEAGNLSTYNATWMHAHAVEHGQLQPRVCVLMMSHNYSSRSYMDVTFHSIRKHVIEPAHALGFSTSVIAASSTGEDWVDFDRVAESTFGRHKVVGKVISPSWVQQFSKTCATVSLLRQHDAENQVRGCDWYIKTRPDFELLADAAFATYRRDAVNTRLRYYRGPLKLQYGASLGGPFTAENIAHMNFAESTEMIVSDDMFFVIHADIAKRAFEDCDYYAPTGRARPELGHILQCETTNARHWKLQSIETHPIDIRAIFHCGVKCADRGGTLVPSGPVNLPQDEWQLSFAPKQPPKSHVHISAPPAWQYSPVENPYRGVDPANTTSRV